MEFLDRLTRGPRALSARRAAAFGITILLLLGAGGCSKSAPQGGAQAAPMAQMPPVPVTVGKATRKTVPVRITVIGNGEAYTTVNVKAQVDGLLQRADFCEGDDVQQGQELFAIDPRPFEAALHQAEANLARDQAQLNNAQDQFQRNSVLFQQGIISKDQEETFRTSAAALEATVKADQAAIENAKIELGYCVIRSPISGRTGALSIKVGNLVKNNDAALVTINQIRPLYVDFSVPEQYLDEIKRRFAAGAMPVTAAIPQDVAHPESGRLAFINNTVDANTGTVMMKASFPNERKRLWPGQFVNVTLTLQSLPNAVVVPSQAVQTGQTGKYVFVVKADNSVEMRPVVAGVTDGGDTVIEKGVADGDTVVTDGQLMLMPGGHVMIRK
ncbi:MAG TPA: efflux RND transporter periplasmic adaptor subunit [Terriglobia bacterium]|nr:efflux RND transporter periplasmic adaptor subunit [Terriglobia bacterium]